jgi:type 1 fimbriae regulatory protein FimB/type 1 fimbriae regulatory protein FimE
MPNTKQAPENAPPRKPRNKDVRGREHLTEEEVDQLRRAASKLGRHGLRDACMILMCFRHGFRVSELVALRWDQIDLARETVFVRRLKRGKNNTQDLARVELSALKKLAKGSGGRQTFVFRNERGGALSRWAFDKMLRRAGAACEPPIAVHPHMLRHACGFVLINDGHSTRRVQDHLGHRNITMTERYTELVPDGGKKLWDD